MELNTYVSISDATSNLNKRGFKAQFRFTDDEKLQHVDTDKKYGTDDMQIVEYHRFEGMTNPGDMSIVFAVEANDGTKGTVVSPYGPYADIKLIEFMDRVKIREDQKTEQPDDE